MCEIGELGNLDCRRVSGHIIINNKFASYSLFGEFGAVKFTIQSCEDAERSDDKLSRR